MSSSKARKLLAKGRSTGIPDLDSYIYGVQLSLVAMLLEGKACMKGSAYLQTGGAFRINPEGLLNIRTDLIDMQTAVTHNWRKEIARNAGKASDKPATSALEMGPDILGAESQDDSEVEPEWMRKGRERAERKARERRKHVRP